MLISDTTSAESPFENGVMVSDDAFMIVAMSLFETFVYWDVRLAKLSAVVSVSFLFTVAAWQTSNPTA